MGNGSELKGRSAKALRAAGYLPLPRRWVTAEQLELILYMSAQNEAEVNRIRGEANRVQRSPEDEIEEAWRQHRKSG
jgi:DUF1680 family protein